MFITYSINKYFKEMVHSGIEKNTLQLNYHFSAMNLHCINHKTPKERENEIGKVIEDIVSIPEERFLLEEVSVISL